MRLMSEVIEGIQVHVKTDELNRLLLEQATRLDTKAADYERRAGLIAEVDEEVEAGYSNTSRSHAPNLRKKAKHTRQAAGALRFQASHLPADRTFSLALGDLHRLGVEYAEHWVD
jgi:hypothetical protein